MAERFGGKFSPANSRPPGPPAPRSAWDGKRRSRAGGRSNLLFVLPFLFLFQAFTGDPSGIVLGFGAFAALLLAAWLTRDGIVAEEAYAARTIAKRPAIPRKIFASILTGAGLFAGGLMGGAGVVASAAMGAIGALLHSAAFGLDPLKDKGVEGVESFQSDRVARAVDEAEKHLAAMKEAIQDLSDRPLAARVESFTATARQMFRSIENDPRDLTAARKYLGVYLMGARDATMKFADLYARTRDAKARSDYETLLDDLESSFATRTQTLLLNDRGDLDVEIGVLRERLQRET